MSSDPWTGGPRGSRHQESSAGASRAGCSIRRYGSIGAADRHDRHLSRLGVPAYDQSVAVDVRTEVEFARPRGEVATYASDPDNATSWYENIKTVEWKTPTRPLSAGARIAFTATFMGRQLAYIYEITDFIPGERLVMTTTDGPFPMETTY